MRYLKEPARVCFPMPVLDNSEKFNDVIAVGSARTSDEESSGALNKASGKNCEGFHIVSLCFGCRIKLSHLIRV